MTAPVIRWQYAGQTSGPRYEAWREEFGRWWVRTDLIPILDDLANCVASEITVSQLSFVTLGRCAARPCIWIVDAILPTRRRVAVFRHRVRLPYASIPTRQVRRPCTGRYDTGEQQ